MRGLLDTHSFLWFVWGDARMSVAARAFIGRADTEIYVSIVSLWEIAIKSSIGKLILDRPIGDFFTDYIEGNGFLILPIERAHLLTVHALPFHHRDPFDRLLVAQSLTDSLTFLSGDVAMDGYGVNRLW